MKPENKLVVVSERTLNFLKLTGLLSPYYLIRRIFYKLTNRKLKSLVFSKIYKKSFRNEEKIPEDYESYYDHIEKGIKKMRNSKVVLCGCVRDEEEIIGTTVSRLEETGKMFKDYRIVIFESDSKDKTLAILKKRVKKNKRIILLNNRKNYPRLKNQGETRMKIMAYCRNKYLEYIQEKFFDLDYMMVFDLDYYGGWNNGGIANTFGHENWDVMGANGLCYGDYHDSYPLRIKNFEDRCYMGGRQKELNKKQIKENNIKWIKAKQPKLKPGEDLFPIVSCFSGLAIYKMKAIKNCKYGFEDCEHVSFHKQIHKRGFKRFFINPSMIIILE